MTPDSLARLRTEYAARGLDEAEAGDDPLALFARWVADAVTSGLHEPNAMVVATADASGAPSARMVLLKGVDEAGLTFFTNYESRKAAEIAARPQVALLLPWQLLERQVRLEGDASRLPRAQCEAYFAGRPRGSQLGAWASPQSQPVPDRDFLEGRYRAAAARFSGQQEIDCPPYWGGYRVIPSVVEFWQGRVNRMHDRLCYRRGETGWVRTRLAP